MAQLGSRKLAQTCFIARHSYMSKQVQWCRKARSLCLHFKLLLGSCFLISCWPKTSHLEKPGVWVERDCKLLNRRYAYREAINWGHECSQPVTSPFFSCLNALHLFSVWFSFYIPTWWVCSLTPSGLHSYIISESLNSDCFIELIATPLLPAF